MTEEMASGNDSGEARKPNLLESFRQLPSNIQRLIIGTAFLTVITGIVVLKNAIGKKLKSKEGDGIEDELAVKEKTSPQEIFSQLIEALFS